MLRRRKILQRSLSGSNGSQWGFVDEQAVNDDGGGWQARGAVADRWGSRPDVEKMDAGACRRMRAATVNSEAGGTRAAIMEVDGGSCWRVRWRTSRRRHCGALRWMLRSMMVLAGRWRGRAGVLEDAARGGGGSWALRWSRRRLAESRHGADDGRRGDNADYWRSHGGGGRLLPSVPWRGGRPVDDDDTR